MPLAQESVDALRSPPVDSRRFVDEAPFSIYQKLVLGLCFVTTFVDGFDTQAVAVAGPMLRTEMWLGPAQLGTIFVSAMIGGIVAALESMGVTEPTTGADTTKIKTTAERKGDRYVVNGQKVWISRIQHSDLMILLARTTSLADVKKKERGHVDFHRRSTRSSWQWHVCTPDSQYGES
jgi:hypothetical protein